MEKHGAERYASSEGYLYLYAREVKLKMQGSFETRPAVWTTGDDLRS